MASQKSEVSYNPNMEKAKERLSVRDEDASRVSGLDVQPPKVLWYDASFYEGFFLRGIRVDRIQAQDGYLSCTFKVPARLTDMNGNLSPGAIACLVDKVGFSSIYAGGHPFKVSTGMSISYMTPAKVDDELEICSRVLGFKGGLGGAHVVLTNKRTGEIVAEGSHSLFGLGRGKM